jgi:hypothetical protein
LLLLLCLLRKSAPSNHLPCSGAPVSFLAIPLPQVHSIVNISKLANFCTCTQSLLHFLESCSCTFTTL